MLNMNKNVTWNIRKKECISLYLSSPVQNDCHQWTPSCLFSPAALAHSLYSQDAIDPRNCQGYHLGWGNERLLLHLGWEKWTINIRSIQAAKKTRLHFMNMQKNRLSGKFIGENDHEMQYFAKKELWFERFWRWNFSILMQLLCSFQLHPAFKSVQICQMLPQNLKFKEKGVFYWFKYILNEYFYSPSFFCELVSLNYVRPHIIYKSKHTSEYFIIFTLAVWCGKSDCPTESQEY